MAHRVTSRPGGGTWLLQLTGHLFQEAGRPLLRAQSGCIIIAPHWSKDTTKRHLLFAVVFGLLLAGLSGPVTREVQLYWSELRSRTQGRGSSESAGAWAE